MKYKSISLNALLNAIKTLLQVIFPLITFPYAARVIGVAGIGKYNFSSSIVNYFILLSGLGIYSYSVREGSSIRENENEFSLFASEIIEFNIISMIISLIILIVLCLFWSKLHNYVDLILILSINIILTTIGCEWVYAIYEEYFYITVRGLIFQVVSMSCLFLFVHSANDLMIYCITTIISGTGYNILNIFGLHKKFKFSLRPISSLKKHFYPIMLLFANSITTTIYVNSDITILGMISGDYSVGLYSVSTKVYSIVKSILASIIVVSIPRMSHLWARGNKQEFGNLGNTIIKTFYIFTIPAMVGIFALSDEIIRVISDDSFLCANISMKILSISLLLSVFNWFFQSAILIPSKNEKYVLYSSGIAALINVILNFILIPKYAQNGAAFTTLFAELVSVVISYYYSRNLIKIDINMKDVTSSLIGCIYIYIFCIVIKKFISTVFISVAFSIIGSLFGYILILLSLKNSVAVSIFNKLYLKIQNNGD